MRENADQNNLEYEHFLRSECLASTLICGTSKGFMKTLKVKYVKMKI